MRLSRLRRSRRHASLALMALLAAGGSGQTRLTDDLADIACSSLIGWSPDGERLLYVCGSDLFNADGSGHTVLTVNRLLDLEPAWRP